MKNLSSAIWLNLWEQGASNSPLHFSIYTISETFPEIDVAKALSLPIGIRDSLLILIRSNIFGNTFTNIAQCPRCGEKIEWEQHSDNFEIGKPEDLLVKERYEFENGEYTISFRLPNTKDILNLENAAEGYAEEQLLNNCLLKVNLADKTIPTSDIPNEIVANLLTCMEKEDRLADINFSLHCPACSHAWNNNFDIVQYFWTEINAWANRMMYEIGVIASNFGWSEKQILDLSPKRRQIYLEMIGA